jgi:hypothetical protein
MDMIPYKGGMVMTFDVEGWCGGKDRRTQEMMKIIGNNEVMIKDGMGQWGMTRGEDMSW